MQKGRSSRECGGEGRRRREDGISRINICYVQELNNVNEWKHCMWHTREEINKVNKNEMGEGDLEEAGGNGIKKRPNLDYVPVLTPQDDCKHALIINEILKAPLSTLSPGDNV